MKGKVKLFAAFAVMIMVATVPAVADGSSDGSSADTNSEIASDAFPFSLFKVYNFTNDYNNHSSFTVSTISDLQKMSDITNGAGGYPAKDFSGKTVYLTGDIDFTGFSSFTPMASSNTYFKGTFDGCGHKIIGMQVESSAAALFGKTSDATIVNLTMKDCVFEGYNRAATFVVYTVGSLYMGNCVSDGGRVVLRGELSSDNSVYAGGLVARCSSGGTGVTIENVRNDASVIATSTTSEINAGGLFGIIEGGAPFTMFDSFNSGSVDAECTKNTAGKVAKNIYVGGLCGSISHNNVGWTFTGNYNAGQITVVSETSNVNGDNKTVFVGGLVGTSSAPMESCYNVGSISFNSKIDRGNVNVGGIVGRAGSYISRCYNTGDISLSITGKWDHYYVGGIVGDSTAVGANITQCYNAGNLSCTVVSINNPANVTGTGLNISGIVGMIQSDITHCYNVGNIYCEFGCDLPVNQAEKTNISGIVSYVSGSGHKITNCYSVPSGDFSITEAVGGEITTNTAGLVGKVGGYTEINYCSYYINGAYAYDDIYKAYLGFIEKDGQTVTLGLDSKGKPAMGSDGLEIWQYTYNISFQSVRFIETGYSCMEYLTDLSGAFHMVGNKEVRSFVDVLNSGCKPGEEIWRYDTEGCNNGLPVFRLDPFYVTILEKDDVIYSSVMNPPGEHIQYTWYRYENSVWVDTGCDDSKLDVDFYGEGTYRLMVTVEDGSGISHTSISAPVSTFTSIVLTGSVSDGSTTAIVGATIRYVCGSTVLYGYTNSNGIFNMDVPESDRGKDATVTVSMRGYEDGEVQMNYGEDGTYWSAGETAYLPVIPLTAITEPEIYLGHYIWDKRDPAGTSLPANNLVGNTPVVTVVSAPSGGSYVIDPAYVVVADDGTFVEFLDGAFTASYGEYEVRFEFDGVYGHKVFEGITVDVVSTPYVLTDGVNRTEEGALEIPVDMGMGSAAVTDVKDITVKADGEPLPAEAYHVEGTGADAKVVIEAEYMNAIPAGKIEILTTFGTPISDYSTNFEYEVPKDNGLTIVFNSVNSPANTINVIGKSPASGTLYLKASGKDSYVYENKFSFHNADGTPVPGCTFKIVDSKGVEIGDSKNTGSVSFYLKVTFDDLYAVPLYADLWYGNVQSVTVPILSVAGYSGVYDGQEHGIAIDVTGYTVNYYSDDTYTTQLYGAPLYSDVGTHPVYFELIKGADTFRSTLYVEISPRDISGCDVVMQDRVYDVDGVSILYDVVFGDTHLSSGVDYRYVSGALSGIAVGDYTFTVRGEGNFTGTKDCTWHIVPAEIDGSMVQFGDLAFTADGTAKTVTVNIPGLTRDVDYTVTGDTASAVGKYTVTVTGKGNYAGPVTAVWHITEKTFVGIPSAVIGLQWTGDPLDGVPAGAGYTVTGGTQTEPGTYKATVSLTDKANTVWSDGTVADIEIGYTIGKATFVPGVTIQEWTYGSYDASVNTPSVTGNLSGGAVTFTYARSSSADYSASVPKFAGHYYVKATVAETDHYAEVENTILFQILPRDINTLPAGSIYIAGNYAYSGTTVTVRCIVPLGVDYNVVEGFEGITAGNYTLKIEGTANYCGEMELPWEIVRKVLDKPTIPALTYNGNEQTVSVDSRWFTVVSGGTQKNAGNYKADIGLKDPVNTVWSDGKVNDVTVSYKINARNLSSNPVIVGTYTYNGQSQDVQFTLKDGNTLLVQGVDYEIKSGGSSTAAGTVKLYVRGINNYAGERNVSWTIGQLALSDETVTVTVGSVEYDGESHTAPVTVVIKGNGYTMVLDTDYTLACDPETEAGNYRFTITGFGSCTGTMSGNWVIVQTSVDIGGCTVTVLTSVYNGLLQAPSVTVMSGTTALVQGVDFTVTYVEKKDAGTYGISVEGTGSYSGSKAASWTIEKRTVYVIAGSANAVYSGVALTSGYTALGIPSVDKGRFEITVSGSQTQIGTSANTVTCVIADDVAPNYSVVTVSGTLTVLEDFHSSVTVTAKSQTVVGYDAQGGEGIMEDTVSETEDFDLAENLFTKDGAEFAGWSTSAGGDVVYSNGQRLTGIRVGTSVTLCASWRSVSP